MENVSFILICVTWFKFPQTVLILSSPLKIVSEIEWPRNVDCSPKA